MHNILYIIYRKIEQSIISMAAIAVKRYNPYIIYYMDYACDITHILHIIYLVCFGSVPFINRIDYDIQLLVYL